MSIVVWAPQAVDRWRRQSASRSFGQAMTEAASTRGAVIDYDRNQASFLRIATAIQHGLGNGFSHRAALLRIVDDEISDVLPGNRSENHREH